MRVFANVFLLDAAGPCLNSWLAPNEDRGNPCDSQSRGIESCTGFLFSLPYQRDDCSYREQSLVEIPCVEREEFMSNLNP
jgi:hypothetical protein